MSDAIAVEVLANQFRAIVEEMAWVVHRSSHTTFIKETLDFGTALVTPEGESFCVIDSTGVTTLIGLPLAPYIDAIENWEVGDVAITNDPYATRGAVMHLSDMFVLKPIFVEGRLLCFAWAFIHCSDVGGNVPGSIDGTNREVFQEGLRIGPMKFRKRGQLNEDLVRIIRDNCRNSAPNWGDLTALVASLDVGEARIQRLSERYGVEAVREAMRGTIDRTEQLTRLVLKQIPRGSYSFTEYLEDDYESEVPVRLRLTMTPLENGSIELDFRGSDPQVQAAINLPTCSQKHHPMLSIALMNTVMTQSPGMHANSGIVRCIDLVLPEASVVNSSFPAACGMRVITSMRVHELVLGALTQALPGKVPAGGASQLAITSISTSQPDGTSRVVVANAVEGGSGGGVGLDGVNGADFPAAALRNVPVEVLEAEAPVLVHRFALRPDSEGAGKFRGGFGIEYAFEIRHPQVVAVTRSKDRHRFTAWGANGGRAGTSGYCYLIRDGSERVAVGKQAMLRPLLGDTLVIGGGGGGGNGHPYERDTRAVLQDVLDGLVSPERARSVYGVAITRHGEIDEAATALLRATPSASLQFEFGPGRTNWERDWLPAYDLISQWLEVFPPMVRRGMQKQAYRAIRDQLAAPYDPIDVQQVLDRLGATARSPEPTAKRRPVQHLETAGRAVTLTETPA